MRIDALCRLIRMGLGIACGLATVAAAQVAERDLVQRLPGASLIAVVDAGASASVASPESASLLDDPELAAALSTSAEGLFEEALPEGGVMVRLQGRFRSVLFASRLESGELRTSHQRTCEAGHATP